jgi:hypothetical protein
VAAWSTTTWEERRQQAAPGRAPTAERAEAHAMGQKKACMGATCLPMAPCLLPEGAPDRVGTVAELQQETEQSGATAGGGQVKKMRWAPQHTGTTGHRGCSEPNDVVPKHECTIPSLTKVHLAPPVYPPVSCSSHPCTAGGRRGRADRQLWRRRWTLGGSWENAGTRRLELQNRVQEQALVPNFPSNTPVSLGRSSCRECSARERQGGFMDSKGLGISLLAGSADHRRGTSCRLLCDRGS